MTRNKYEYKIVVKEIVNHTNMRLETRFFIYKRKSSSWGAIMSKLFGWEFVAVHYTFEDARAAVGLCKDEDLQSSFIKTTYC